MLSGPPPRLDSSMMPPEPKNEPQAVPMATAFTPQGEGGYRLLHLLRQPAPASKASGLMDPTMASSQVKTHPPEPPPKARPPSGDDVLAEPQTKTIASTAVPAESRAPVHPSEPKLDSSSSLSGPADSSGSHVASGSTTDGTTLEHESADPTPAGNSILDASLETFHLVGF